MAFSGVEGGLAVAAAMPSASVDLPSGSVDMPSGSLDVPSVDQTGKGPDMASVGGDISGDLPSASVDASGSLPSADVDVSVPSGSVDVPSVDVKKPKKSLFGGIGGIFGSGKGKMEVRGKISRLAWLVASDASRLGTLSLVSAVGSGVTPGDRVVLFCSGAIC